MRSRVQGIKHISFAKNMPHIYITTKDRGVRVSLPLGNDPLLVKGQRTEKWHYIYCEVGFDPILMFRLQVA